MANKIYLMQNYIQVACDRNDTATQDALSVFYPMHRNKILTQFKLSTKVLPELLAVLRPKWETEAPQELKDAVYRELWARTELVDLLTNGPRQSCVINQNLTLMRHQQLGRELARVYDRFGFFYDTRTGKTPLSLAIIADDIHAHPDHKWLVVCPLILIKEAWLGDSKDFFPELTVINCHAATPAKRIEQINKPGQIYLTNTESFINYRQHFDKLNFAGVFIDESSDMKSHKSKISAELVDFAQTVKKFYLLSGTPAPNGEWEYYMQLKSIDFCSVPQSYSQFKERFFTNVSFNPQYEKLALRPDRAEELYTQIKKYAMYVDKEDVLDTPGRTFEEVELVMPDELKQHYNKLRQDLYLELEGTLITAPSAAAKLNKLNQLTSGFIIDTHAVKHNAIFKDEPNFEYVPEWHFFDDYRFKALDQLLQANAGEQVIIWCNYKREFEILQDRLGDKAGFVYGDVSLTEKESAIKNFKQGKLQYLVANPASADKGLTLTNCHIAVYFSLNWSYELYKQSTERIYGDRRIQPKPCEYYIFMAKGTIDRILYREVLQGKKVASELILNHLKADEHANKNNKDTKF